MRKKFAKNNVPLMLLGAVIASALGLVFYRPPEVEGTRKSSKLELLQSAVEQRLQKFSLTGFDDKGRKFWNLEGETAKIELGQTVFLEDRVTLRLKDNTVIVTDHVEWSQDQGLLRTNAPVFVTRDATKIRGIGAIGRLKENFVQLNRDVHMLLSPTATLTCFGPMKIFYHQNTMVFYRSVKVTDERGTLTANRMDVHFDPQEKNVKEIVALGNVVIHRGDDTTHSRRAVYTPSTGSVRLEGSPEIILHRETTDILDAPLRN